MTEPKSAAVKFGENLKSIAAFNAPAWKERAFYATHPLYCAAGCHDGAIRVWNEFQDTVAAIKSDADLSASGKAKKLRAAAENAVKEVARYEPAYKSIRKAEDRVIRERLTPTKLTDVADRIAAALRETEIRAGLVAAGKRDSGAARSAFEDALAAGNMEVVDAILNAPPATPLRLQEAFLADARTRRIAALDPEAARELEEIRTAANDIEKAMATATRMITEAGGLGEDRIPVTGAMGAKVGEIVDGRFMPNTPADAGAADAAA